MHDPQKTLSDLRDHLARHDKPIAFFFGAGTSCAVKVSSAAGGDAEPLIPNVAGLTQKCQEAIEALGDNFAASWASIAAQCEAAKQDPNVENILSRVRMMLAAVGDGDTLSGLGRPEIGRFEETVRQTIARIVTPDHARIPSELPHRAFGQWLARTARQHPVEIFTGQLRYLNRTRARG